MRPEMHDILQTLNISELQRLHRAAQYFDMKNLKDSVAVMIAAIVYVEKDYKHFEQRKKELNIKKEHSFGFLT